MSEVIRNVKDCQRLVVKKGVEHNCHRLCGECPWAIPELIDSLRKKGLLDTKFTAETGITSNSIEYNDQGQIVTMVPTQFGVTNKWWDWETYIYDGNLQPRKEVIVDFQIYGEAGAAWGY